MPLKLVVVTPEKKVVDTDTDQVEVPGELGYLGILPGHAPLISLLKTGVLTYRAAGGEKALAISTGFVEVAGDAVSVLADVAEETGRGRCRGRGEGPDEGRRRIADRLPRDARRDPRAPGARAGPDRRRRREVSRNRAR